MKNINDFFSPFNDAVGTPGDLKELMGMRRDTVSQYGLFAPDTVYPVYLCPECKAQEVSLSILAPDLELYEDFETFVTGIADLVGALPLAPCKGCGRSNPSQAAWVGFFTYLAQAQADLFLRIENSQVEDAFKIPLTGDPERLGPLSEDGRFLELFGFPFCHRWAWHRLIETFGGSEGLHIKGIDDGWYLAIDGSGSSSDEKWQGWYAAHSKEYELDSIALLSRESREYYSGGTPELWLNEAARRAYEAGQIKLVVFYSLERYRRLLEATLLQRGIQLHGQGDPFIIAIEEYSCEVPLESLLRSAAFSAYPPDRVLRKYLLGRIEHLEALRGLGRRLRRSFDENYLSSIEDGHVLKVQSPDDEKLLRSIDLSQYSEWSSCDSEEYEKLLAEEFAFDCKKDTFKEAN